MACQSKGKGWVENRERLAVREVRCRGGKVRARGDGNGNWDWDLDLGLGPDPRRAVEEERCRLAPKVAVFTTYMENWVLLYQLETSRNID
ncbi:hypothetical protein ANO14919_067550 [Xylariales sp. No.14919]|nr:hypothetical protein ANO14919_067550 [Xylariales sp. No.14919]